MLTLGGDHFIAYPLLKAHAKKHGAPLSLIHFDAHSDTWPDQEARVDHGTMFFHAAKEGLVEPTSSIQVGLRTTNPDTLGFNIIDAPAVHENGIVTVVEKIRSVVGDRPAYLTFDIDCLDPSNAPGTGTPVCGGLTSYQAIEILRGLAASILSAWTLWKLHLPMTSARLPHSRQRRWQWRCCICTLAERPTVKTASPSVAVHAQDKALIKLATRCTPLCPEIDGAPVYPNAALAEQNRGPSQLSERLRFGS